MIKQTLSALALLAASAVPLSAPAEVLFTETFDYTAGSAICGQDGWIQTNHKDDPIKVSQTTLSHPDFLSGKSIKLGSSTTTAQDVAHACVPVAADGTLSPITTGDIYIAMLINVQDVTAAKQFFSGCSTNYSYKLNDGTSLTGDYNRLFASPGDTDGTFKLGLSKSTTTVTPVADLELNKTHLVVMHIKLVEGTNNDLFEVWVNPSTEQMPAATVSATNGADYGKGFAGIAIHQATNFSGNCPDMLVGPVKVATTWSELFDGQGGGGQGGDDPVVGDPAINATSPSLPQGFALYTYQTYPVTVNVKGTALTEDITIEGLDAAVTSTTTSIPASAAMSDGGFDLKLTLKANGSAPIKNTITLTSGTAVTSVKLNVDVYPANQLMNFRAAPNVAAWETYYYNGNAWVTYVDKPNHKMYLQDIVGGIVVDYDMYESGIPCPYKEGDKINKFYLIAGETSLNTPQFYLAQMFTSEGLGYAPLVAENDFRTPIETTLADLKDNPEDYINRLVKVTDLTFTKAGETFTTGVTAVTSGSATGSVRPFAGTDLIGTEIPATATVTGISTSMSAAVITVRKAADVETPQEESGLTIDRTLLVDAAEYYPIGVETPFATLKVKATNMPKATSIWIGGAQRNAFIIDRDEIPAGSGEYTINIIFKPSATGRSQAMINFDASPTELSQSLSLAALAYDPDNLPQFSVTPTSIDTFTAAPSTEQEQTLTVTASKLLDYGQIKVQGTSGGAFRVNTTSFLKEGNTTIRVTFAPKAAGTYTETIIFSTPKAETVTVTVSGTCSGDKPVEDKQGDELTFDTSAPLAKYSTDFTDAGANNKPLSLPGWKNVALDGTRAFWAYTTDGNTMAKVTAYDSQADTDTPAEMLLLSPALDYVNSPSRLLEFSITGDFLTAGMADQFSVLYIDPTLPEDNGRYQVIGGVDVPATADDNGETRKFVLDLDGLDIADTFFIGFHYLGNRGRNSSAVYYVDDFSWGSETTPFIRVDKNVINTNGSVNTSTKIDDITVTGMNLKENISIGLEGAHKEHFALSHTELPAEGGQFAVHYAPTEADEHSVYVTLKSADAPAVSIYAGGNSVGTSGLGQIGNDDEQTTLYFDLQGNRIYKPAPGQLYIRVTNGVATKHLHR